MDTIEQHIFARCFRHVFAPQDSDDALQDRHFNQKLLALETLSFKSFCGEDDLREPKTMERLISILSEMAEALSPTEKAEAVVQLIKAAAEEHESNDVLIPILSWLLVHARDSLGASSLISNIRYIQRFHNPARLTGEVAFCLTNLVHQRQLFLMTV